MSAILTYEIEAGGHRIPRGKRTIRLVSGV